MNAKLFKIRLLKCEIKSVLDRDPHRKPDSETCECKALSEHDSCVRILEMHAEAMHPLVNQRGLRSSNKILPHSAQILFVIGTAFAMLVNAHSSNREPNQEADRDQKWLSERD